MQQQLHFNDAVYGLGAGMFLRDTFLSGASNLCCKGGSEAVIAVLMLRGSYFSTMIFVTSPKSFM